MTKIKLTDDTIIEASSVELVHGALRITTPKMTVEKLAKLFKDTTKTCLMKLLTEGDEEIGYREGFTSFAGIEYDTAGNKTIVMFQPADSTENRVALLEATNAKVLETTATNSESILDVQAQVDYLTMMSTVEV